MSLTYHKIKNKRGEYKMEKLKEETTIQLENMCERIAQEISTGEYGFDSDESEYDEPCAADYLENMLDYRYTINAQKGYMGADILVVFGGPNIWVNTLEKCVKGYWGSDEITRYYVTDSLGICDYMEDLYNSDPSIESAHWL